MEEIIITADKSGKVTIEVQGVKGSGCHDLTAGLERTLGTVVSDTETQEAYDNVEGIQDISRA